MFDTGGGASSDMAPSSRKSSTSSSSKHGSKKPRAKIKRSKINKKINTRFRIEKDVQIFWGNSTETQRKTMEDIQEGISRLSRGQISKGVFGGILERKNKNFPDRRILERKDIFPFLEDFFNEWSI